MTFAHYLEKIRLSKNINVPVFLKKSEALSISEEQLLKIISWKKIKGSEYSVTIIDIEAFGHLIERFPTQIISNRVEASIAGNSHSKRVSGSMVTLLAYQQIFPQVVVFDKKGGYQTQGKLYSNLLIIENLENFLILIKHPDYLTRWLGNKWACDIVYAHGNAVSNQLHQQFFSHYKHIRCLLDIDPGGFKIYKSIYNLVPKKVCEYVLSDYYLNKYRQYGYAITHQEKQELLTLAPFYPKQLEQVINTILKHNKFAEQEILLWS